MRRYLLGLILVFSVLARAQSPQITAEKIRQLPQSLQRALLLKAEVDAANTSDLEALATQVAAFRTSLQPQEFENGLKRIREKLKTDRELFLKVQPLLGSQAVPSLQSSLVKLIGDPKAHRTGILEDALALSQEPKVQNILYVGLTGRTFRANQITVAKTLLFYAVVVFSEGANRPALQMLYPVPLPTHLEQTEVRESALFLDKKLCIPNAGFVYGGDFIDGRCRGVDCSAFVAYCEEHTKRLTTMILSYATRELEEGMAAFSSEEMKVRDEFIRDYGYDKLILLYEAPDIESVEDLKAGDVVTWRGAKGGHTVLVLEPLSDIPGQFWAIEANREDDKSKEGIGIDRFSLIREKAETYVLRRKG